LDSAIDLGISKANGAQNGGCSHCACSLGLVLTEIVAVISRKSCSMAHAANLDSKNNPFVFVCWRVPLFGAQTMARSGGLTRASGRRGGAARLMPSVNHQIPLFEYLSLFSLDIF